MVYVLLGRKRGIFMAVEWRRSQDKICLKLGDREAFDHEIRNKDRNRTPIITYAIFASNKDK
jgi:hypothetical protein